MIYQKNNLILSSDLKVSEVILDNPHILLMLEHFGIGLELHEKTIEQICSEYNIRVVLFEAFANLFNGYSPSPSMEYSFDDITIIVKYLKRSHQYYLDEKYPSIHNCIQEMYKINDQAEILMLEKFFNEYFDEVVEHLNYENDIVFPYVINLYDRINNKESKDSKEDYSAADYKDHHNDIEEKLADLNNLLIKYLPQKNDQKIRRELLFNLFELEHDLNIHAMIEDTILIPLVEKMEKYLRTC